MSDISLDDQRIADAQVKLIQLQQANQQQAAAIAARFNGAQLTPTAFLSARVDALIDMLGYDNGGLGIVLNLKTQQRISQQLDRLQAALVAGKTPPTLG